MKITLTLILLTLSTAIFTGCTEQPKKSSEVQVKRVDSVEKNIEESTERLKEKTAELEKAVEELEKDLK